MLVPALLTLAACAGAGPQAPRTAAPPDTVPGKSTANAPATMPAEDVSKYRPVFTRPAPVAGTATPVVPKAAPAPSSHVTPQIEQRLRDQAVTNQNVKYAQGYRVLAYLGLERDKVMSIRRAVISRYPEETDYIVFKAPVYRLYIGDYLTKLEAARGLSRVRPLTQKAELEAMQVQLNKNP